MATAQTKMDDLIKIKVVKDSLSELENLGTLKVDAANRFNDAVEVKAKEAGLEKTVLSQFVMAKVNDKEQDFARKCGQLSLLSEEIG